jgi:putative transposase
MVRTFFLASTRRMRALAAAARDLVHLLRSIVRSRQALAAENLFLRKQLALFQERKVRPRRADDATRLIMVVLGHLFPWRNALLNVKPDTFVR